MALDANIIFQGLQAGLGEVAPVSNLLSGFQSGQQLQRNALENQLLQQRADLAPLQQRALEQDLAIGEQGLAQGDIKTQILQENLNALGVPDVPTAKEVAFNFAKVAELPTIEAKLSALNNIKQNAIKAGRTTENVDELLDTYARSPEEGEQLLGAGVRAFEKAGFLTPEISQDLEMEKLNLRKQELALDKQREQRQGEKLSSGLEQALLSSQDAVVKAQRDSSEFDILANQVSDLELSGGVKSTTSETLKALLGTQDDVTELRRRFNSVRLSEGLKNLPPGPATDKDMEQAFKGVPPENAPASQIASFLRGAAKMARFEAGYNQFKSDYITDKSTAKGLNREWRKSVNSSVLDRNVTIAEIYAEAAASGLTPEEVKAELGIQE